MQNEKNILNWFNREGSQEDLGADKDARIFEKIAHYASHIDVPKVDVESALANIKTRTAQVEKVKVRRLHVSRYYKMAVAAIVVLALGYFTLFNTTKSYQTDIAQTIHFNLPDQSEVTLNANSSISFNKKSWKEQRDLELNGEAYFKVEKGQKFTVITSQGKVQVLGTQFNVKERDDYFEVHCYEGLVAVSYNGSQLQLSKGKTFRIVDGQPSDVTDFGTLAPEWLSDESSFKEVPYKEVIAEFERQFDLKIEMKQVDENQLFTGSFTHNNKNTALKSITIPLQLSYKIDGKNVIVYKYEGN